MCFLVFCSAGCGGLAWNVTPGLPTAFGARFVLNVWFPAPSSSNSSGDSAQRFVLLPASSNSSAGSNNTAGTAADVVFSPGGKPLLQQSLTDIQAIVAIEPRRFFANISATNDYSFADTPVLGPQPGANSSAAGGGGQLVRRRREPNSRMPAYISEQLAWGSPPVGGSMVSVALLRFVWQLSDALLVVWVRLCYWQELAPLTCLLTDTKACVCCPVCAHHMSACRRRLVPAQAIAQPRAANQSSLLAATASPAQEAAWCVALTCCTAALAATLSTSQASLLTGCHG